MKRSAFKPIVVCLAASLKLERLHQGQTCYCKCLLLVRLVLWVIIQENPGAFNLMGPVCSSWGVPNRGTSKRDFINWTGAQHLPYIADANCMISRSLSCRLLKFIGCTISAAAAKKNETTSQRESGLSIYA